MSEPTDPKPEATPASETPAQATPPAPEDKSANITKLALERLGYLVEDELPPEPPAEGTPPAEPPAEGTPPAAPADGTPPAEPPAAPPAAPAKPETPKIRRKTTPPAPAPTVAEIVKSTVEAMRQPTPPAPAPTPPAAPELPDFDREEYELAKFAAEAMPDKYKGIDQKVLGYFQKRDAEIQAIIKEDGEFDPQSERFQKFMRENRPQFHGADRQRLMREQVKREAAAEADKKLEVEKKRFEVEIRRLEVAPVIRQETQASAASVLEIDDEAVKEFKADPKKAADENPIEAPIIGHAISDVSAMTEEYLKISNGLVAPSAENPTHVALSNLIEHQGKLLDAMPEAQRAAPDGRVFVSRETWAKLKDAKDPLIARFRPIDDQLAVGMIREFGRYVVKSRLAETRQRLEKAGFKRNKAAPPPPAAPAGATPPAAPPAAPAKPAPKGTVPPAPPPPSRPAGKPSANPHLKFLGISDDDE